MQTILYFSYGSNLNVWQMSRRCPSARKIKPLPVYGARLVFRGVADIQITDNPDDVILGGLWRITRGNETTLDRYEGVDSHLYTKEYFYLRNKSRHYFPVLYYRMTSSGIFPPSQHYLDSIVEGYLDFGLDLTKLDQALHHAWDDKDKTDDIRQRYLRDRPTLAREVKRPFITAPRPQPIRPIGQNKYQPIWPTTGPYSKPLPASRQEEEGDPNLPTTNPWELPHGED